MALPEGKVQISVTVPKDVLKRIDGFAARFGKTRSDVLIMAFGNAEEDLRLLDTLGLSPEHLSKVTDLVNGAVKSALVPFLKKVRRDSSPS